MASVREAYRKISVEEAEAANKAQQERIRKDAELQERYARECEPAMLGHRSLYQKLLDLAAGEKIEELVGKGRIVLPYLRSEYNLPEELRRKKGKARLWEAKVMMPVQLPDGFVSPNLVIGLRLKTEFYRPIDWKPEITVTYTPAEVLTVSGNSLTFGDTFNERKRDLAGFCEGLVRATKDRKKVEN